MNTINSRKRREEKRREEKRREEKRREEKRREDGICIIGCMDNTMDNTFESANRVYNTTGIAPTVTTCGGGGLQPKIVEVKKLNDDIKPILLGGVGEENEFGKQYRQGNRVYNSDGIAMAITSQPVGNAGGNSYLYCTKEKVSDAQSLRMVRTEEGKALRKAYESGEFHHGFNEYRTAEPINDDVSNTITTVQKDNMILETKQLGHIEKGTGKHQSNIVYDSDGLSPCICAGMGVKQQPTMIMEEKLCCAMRGRNPDNPSDRTAGIELEQKLEIQQEDICNCLTSVQKDNMILEIKNQIDEKYHNFIYDIDGDLYLIRIRKLTPKECWRLMGFTDEDFHKAEAVNSNTQLYKQAGNSIVKNVLVAILGQLFAGKEEVYKNI